MKCNILIAGCGYVGTQLGLDLAAAGHAVWGLRRNAAELPPGLHPFAADLSLPETLRPLPGQFDYVFYTAGASGFDEASYRRAYVEGLRNVLDALAAEGQRPKRIFFTSSTGVYHQDDGEWLDEDSPALPARFSGRVLLEAEALLLQSAFPATVCRLGGIYGPGRTRLIEMVRRGEAECASGRTHYLNLIHRDDAAGVLAHLMSLEAPDPLYLVVDDEPVERCALLRWIAQELGVAAPRVVEAQEGHEPQRGGNRRVSNARLKRSGYTFRYASYRQGYGDMLGS